MRPAFASVYLVPVVAASWFGGPMLGFAAAAVSSGASAIAGGFGAEPLARVVMPTLANLAAAWLVLTLRGAYAHERALARTDAVTGAPNRRAFEERARALLRQHARTGRPFTAAGLDLDGFKAVNDRLGHAEGDRVLRAVAETLAGAVRSTDFVARCGGDEFALLLPDTDERGAQLLLARLRGALCDAMAAGGWPVTFSVGAVSFREAEGPVRKVPRAGLPANERDLMQLVDARVYEAKNAGKDQMVHQTRGVG
ncbi:MAG: GGDEF domain-containing protein [Pseudomonadota bacterium]|nr:GGDEF domain-containing protein [Pseudomonadota bacterium]